LFKRIPYSNDVGLFIIRLGLGIMFILHGLPKLMGGPKLWEGLAQKGLPMLPDGFLSIVFGLAAALAEAGGGLLLILGLYYRFGCAALGVTMIVAASTKMDGVSSLYEFAKVAGWPVELAVVMIGLFIIGPGSIGFGRRSS